MTLSKASSLLITQRSRSEYWSASPLARDPRRNAATIRSSAEQASTKRETTRLWSRIAPGPLTPAASQDWSQSARGQRRVRFCDSEEERLVSAASRKRDSARNAVGIAVVLRSTTCL